MCLGVCNKLCVCRGVSECVNRCIDVCVGVCRCRSVFGCV